MLNRCTRHLRPTLAFTPLEVELLNQLVPNVREAKSHSSSLNGSLTRLACLGGYLNRAGDSPPGNTVIWRGLSRLTDIEIGYLLSAQHLRSRQEEAARRPIRRSKLRTTRTLTPSPARSFMLSTSLAKRLDQS